MSLKIYHNPRCSKSRQTLDLIQQSGVDHTIILYKEEMPSVSTLLEMASRLELPVAELLRRGEAEFKQASDLPNLDDDRALAKWLVQHPIVLQRPIVVDQANGKTVIGRPPENVLELLQ